MARHLCPQCLTRVVRTSQITCSGKCSRRFSSKSDTEQATWEKQADKIIARLKLLGWDWPGVGANDIETFEIGLTSAKQSLKLGKTDSQVIEGLNNEAANIKVLDSEDNSKTDIEELINGLDDKPKKAVAKPTLEIVPDDG